MCPNGLLMSTTPKEKHLGDRLLVNEVFNLLSFGDRFVYDWEPFTTTYIF